MSTCQQSIAIHLRRTKNANVHFFHPYRVIKTPSEFERKAHLISYKILQIIQVCKETPDDDGFATM